MRRTRPATLALVTVAAAAVIALGMQLGSALRYSLAVTTWVEWFAILLLAGMILWLGNSVRLYQKGDKPNLDPIRAARTLALAKAGSLTGAALLGRYGAVVVVTLADWNFGSARRWLLSAAVACLCALLLVVAALVAEHWCELPPSQPEAPLARKRLDQIPEGSTAYADSTSYTLAETK